MSSDFRSNSGIGRSMAVVAVMMMLAGRADAQIVKRVPGDYPNIQAALNAAPTSGWVIEVAPGTWVGKLDFLGKGVQLKAAGNWTNTTLQGNNTDTVVELVGTPLGTLVQGFTITGGRGKPFPSSYGFDSYGGAIFCASGSATTAMHATICACRLTGNGLPVQPSGGYPYPGATFGGGIFVAAGQGPSSDSADVTLDHCIIDNNYAWACGGGVMSSGTNANVRLERCTVTNNTDTSFFGWASGVGGANGSNTWVKDSIVWGNAQGAIAPFGGSYASGVDFYVTYSDVTGGFAGAGNLNANPTFVNAVQAHWGLLPGSPCIDAGNPASPLDPDGTRADIGAWPLPGNSLPCAAMGTCLSFTSPAPLGWWGTFALHTPTPNAPIIVVADLVSIPHPIGNTGATTGVGLSSDLFVIADATGVLGSGVVTPYVDALGSWSVSLPLPLAPVNNGQTGYAEAYVLDPTSPNGLFRQSNLVAVTLQS